ncbi:hypothetical protein FIU28_17490 [Tardiphaga sp. vice154]|uniref:hypothetical protein n=1 Tax=Tardiphaga sp. vice154 TaxID=2592814 RepID=UPI0011645160|nr:hypothetical protein [Tardiphaga sp. vice154]QDM22746.1 hypothetical protein FIU28_17490 [Tardiphaga sp. vice154]
MAPQNPFKNMPASKPKQPVVAAQPPVILAKQPSSIAPAKVTMTAMPKMPQAKAKPATPEVVVATPAPVVVQETSWDAALTAKREENAEKALRVRRDAVAARASTPYVAPKEGEEEPWRVAAREQNERNEAISLQMRKADEEKRAREAAAAARVATAYVAPEVESEETEEAIIAPAAWNADDGYTVVPDENDEDREPFTIQTTPREQHYARPVAVTSPRRPFPGSQPVVEKKLKTFTVVLTPDLMLPSKSYLENVPRDDVPWRSVELEFIYDDDRRMRVVKEGFRAITENEARMLPFFNEDERKVRSWQCRLLGIEDARDLYGKDKEWSTGPTCHLLALPTRVLKLHATTGRPLSETETQPSSGLMSSRVGVLPAAEGRPPMPKIRPRSPPATGRGT